MSSYQNDIAVLRELASKKAEIAALDIQEQKRQMWRALNSLHPVRPMVTISQMPWHELEAADASLTLQCTDPFFSRRGAGAPPRVIPVAALSRRHGGRAVCAYRACRGGQHACGD